MKTDKNFASTKLGMKNENAEWLQDGGLIIL